MAPRSRSVKRHKFEPDSVQKALVNTIVLHELPFSVVEQDEVKTAIETAFPGFQVPSSEMLLKNCAKLFMDEKLKLKSFIKRIKQKVCISLDAWRTSDQSVNYLCITAHFIDEDWNLHKKIIGFSPLVCSDDGEEIGRVVEKCLLDWEISNVLAISAGNASSYDAAISYLGPRLTNPVLDGKYARVKCFVELANTMVKGVLKEYEESIARVRAAVGYVLQSPGRIRKFKQLVIGMEGYELFQMSVLLGTVSSPFLALDCPSRWTSTFEMLEIAERLRSAFDCFAEEDPRYIYKMSNTCGVLESSDWGRISNAVFFLSAFYRSNEKILGSRVTANIFLDEISDIDYHLDNWTKSWYGNKKGFFKACDLKGDYFRYWGGEVENSNMLIYIAKILDPRHKNGLMERYFRQCKYRHDYIDGIPLWKKKAEWVGAAAYDLFNEYAGKIGSPQQMANFQTSDYVGYLYHDTDQKREVDFGGDVRCETDIDVYLGEDTCFEHYDGFDILVWWKFNSERFPVLSKMAKDVLAIPISAVPLESDINIDGNVLDDFRSSLSPSVVEALICTRDWINKPEKQTKVKEGSTKLADKVLKGVYEQLKGATRGSR